MSNELTYHPGQFDEVIHIIDNARSRAMKAVNAELIQMYWSVGAVHICLSFVLHQALVIRLLTKLPHILRKRTPALKASIVAVSIV